MQDKPEIKIEPNKFKKTVKWLLRNPINLKTIHKKELPGRNEPCICGSGKKFKHCCWNLYNVTQEAREDIIKELEKKKTNLIKEMYERAKNDKRAS